MINLYCDESHDGITYSLAGWIASPEAWDSITLSWDAMLKKHKAPAFHAVEIVEREHISDSRFKRWTFDQERAIFTDATGLILDKKCPGWLCSIGCSVSIPKIKTVLSTEPDNIWYLLFVRLIHLLAVELPPRANELSLTFDEKKEVRKIVDSYYLNAKEIIDRKLADKFRNPTVGFGRDEEIKPLQIADFFAYEWRKRLSDKLRNPQKPERKSYSRLKERPRFLKYYTSNDIEAIQKRVDADESFIEVMWNYPANEE